MKVVLQPLEIEISEVYTKGIQRRKIGKMRRKSKGREYVSPRILLPRNLQNYVGQNAIIFECKGSVKKGKFINLKDKKILILVFP